MAICVSSVTSTIGATGQSVRVMRWTFRRDDETAMSAFQRHTALERVLVGEGWSLESFESGRLPR